MIGIKFYLFGGTNENAVNIGWGRDFIFTNTKCTELLHQLFTSWSGSAEVSEIFKRNRVECKNFYSVMKAGDCKLMFHTPARAAPIPSVWRSGAGATQFTVNRRSFLLNRHVNGPVLSIAGYVTAGSAQGRRIMVNCFNQLFELQHDGTCWQFESDWLTTWHAHAQCVPSARSTYRTDLHS